MQLLVTFDVKVYENIITALKSASIGDEKQKNMFGIFLYTVVNAENPLIGVILYLNNIK